jgi:hypothetical protein
MARGGGQGAWTRGHVLGAVAIVATVLAGIPDWVGLLERWGFQAGVVLQGVAWVQARRAWVVVALCVSVAVAVGRRYWEPIKGGLTKVRGPYARAIGRLAGPLRGEVLERVRAGRSGGEAGEARRKTEIRLPDGRDPLVLLLYVLAAARDRDPGEIFEVRAAQVFAEMHDRELAARGRRRLAVACKALERSGVLSQYKMTRGQSAVVWLTREVWRADRAGGLFRLVSEELEKRLA